MQQQKQLKVLLIGDSCTDEYVYGSCERLNPEAPVPILDQERMNRPGQGFYKVLAESALRAIQLCQPLRVPSTGYERWKDLQLNFDAREMLEG